MNIRVIIYSGIMTALIGAMIGWAISYIAQREMRTKAIIIGGATLGFVVGAFQESVRQQKKLRESEDEDGESN